MKLGMMTITHFSIMNKKHCLYKHKWQLVNWAIGRWPMEASRFKKMKKKQLYAIFYNTNP